MSADSFDIIGADSAARTLQMLSLTGDALLHSASEQVLLDEFCRVAVEIGGYRMAAVLYALQDAPKQVRAMSHAGVDQGYFDALSLSWAENRTAPEEPVGRTIYSGQRVHLSAIPVSPNSAPWAAAAAARGFGSCIVLPLAGDGGTFGAFALYLAEAGTKSHAEQRLLSQIANNLAFGILKLRAELERRSLLDAVHLVTKTSTGLTGTVYLQKMLPALVQALGAQAGFIAESAVSPTELVRPLCAVVDGQLIADFAYSIAGTPCEDIMNGGRLIIAQDVCKAYPAAKALASLGMQAYAGKGLVDSDGTNIGTFFVLFRQPLARPDFVATVLDLCAARVAAEIVRERADAKLQEQAMLLDQAHDAIFSCTLDHRVVHWNRGASRLYGWAANEVAGRSVIDFKVGDLEHYSRAMDCLLRDGSWDGDLVEVTKDGRRLTIECHWTLLRAADGSPLSKLAINKDVTEQRQAEQQRVLLETAVGLLNDVIIITESRPIDGTGPRIVFASDAISHRHGYGIDTLIGKTPRIFQGPKTSRVETQRIRQALLEYKPVSAELINYRGNGEPFWIELDIAPVFNAGGDCTHFVSVQRDITARKLAEQRLDESESRLVQAQKLEAIGQLTGGIAHDFNNILTVIIGSSESLLEELTDPRLVELARMAMQAGERGAELTNRLLAFGRRQALEPRMLRPIAVLMGMLPMLRQTLGENIRVDARDGNDTWPVFVDPGQLEAAVLNLCINARDAMPEGGALLMETLNTQLDQNYCGENSDVQPGDYVMVAISDTGSGIAPEFLMRVFDPFFTTKAEGKGSGLGLSMVYGFTKQSGGHVRIYSEVGSGTTVKLYLPRADSVQPELQADSLAMAEMELRGSETILLVEDDEMVRSHATRLLSSQGYRILQASDADEALEIVDSAVPIDLLFTDVVLPGPMNGAKLAAEFAQRRPGIPILYTSGYTENAIVHHNRVDPGVQLLHKPYARRALLSKVREVLHSANGGIG